MTEKKCKNCLYLIKTDKDLDCIKGKHTDDKIDDYLNYYCNYWRLKE